MKKVIILGQGTTGKKLAEQCAIQNVIGSFNTLIATVIGGAIGLSIGIVGIFILNCL